VSTWQYKQAIFRKKPHSRRFLDFVQQKRHLQPPNTLSELKIYQKNAFAVGARPQTHLWYI